MNKVNSNKGSSSFEKQNNTELNKLRLVLEQTPGSIFILDHKFKFEYVNPSFSALSGYTKEELVGNTVAELFYHKDLPESRNEIVNSLLKGEKWQGELLTFNKNGSMYWANTIASPYKDENGRIDGYIIIQHDITERKRIELELKKSERKYRELTEMLPLAVYELDVNGKPTYMNRTGLKLFGWEEKVAPNMDATSFFSLEDKKLMQQKLEEEVNKMISVNEPTEPEPSTPVEYTAISSNGKRIPVIIYGSPIIENGKAVGSRGVIVDISERKAMENALRESEEKYKTLIENSQDGIFAIVEDKIHFANTTFCKMVGYTPEELYNKSAVSLVYPGDRARGLAISELRKQGNHSTMNDIFRFVAKDGSVKEGDVFSSVLELNGQIVSYITVHDLTETRKIQEQLTKSEQKYRELSEMLPQTVYELDLNANLKYLNKAGREKFGTAYETSDVSVFSIVVPEELERMKENFTRVSFKNIPSKGNFYKLRQVDGQIFEAMISATPMIVDGKTIGQRGVVVDISDRIKIEDELQLAKNELEKLNSQLEKRVKESSKRLTEARTQLINLQKENLQSQYDVLKQQVNPHFLFNSLNVLTSLIKLEPDLAEKFSEQLSKVYRYVLENKDNELVDLQTELSFLDAYIFLLNIRFVGKLVVDLSIPDEHRNDRIIPLAMQLLIENAIKHNVMSKSNPLYIDIFVDADGFLNIVNNLQERPSQIVSTGVGLKNILNRYQLLNLELPTFEKTAHQFIAKIKLIQ